MFPHILFNGRCHREDPCSLLPKDLQQYAVLKLTHDCAGRTRCRSNHCSGERRSIEGLGEIPAIADGKFLRTQERDSATTQFVIAPACPGRGCDWSVCQDHIQTMGSQLQEQTVGAVLIGLFELTQLPANRGLGQTKASHLRARGCPTDS